MSSLLGLVNYSDDEGSSEDENNIPQPIKKQESKEKPKQAPPLQPPKPSLLATPPPIIEYNRRLNAALTPKPIEGVDHWGIPSESDLVCDSNREEKIAHFLSLRASGHRLNDHLQHNKAFRNPRIYAKLVEFTEVDEFGSNFDKQEFDPYGFPKEMYIDGILETQKKIAEEKAAQQQNRTSVNFVSSQQPALTQQQSTTMAQAMAAAAKVASRIAKPPSMETTGDKRSNKWEDDYRSSKR
ncbi:HCNGP-like protein-domain-containing protein [Gilbertella persicaria]|uniref:HCNGP-like protein-domain-containing protein n=1 Tax=Gilbertella persicaria TaxID=101096 RepID=UPI00221EE02A|nr:HCNGP-like protein-domain-containing protein [Gilbertella persicaria]KAI8064337.1 HCNGP-like protein-domain-containing protein [Gilbertella persicaria]